MSDNIVEFKIKLRDEAGNAVQNLSAGIEGASDAAEQLAEHLKIVGEKSSRIAEVAFCAVHTAYAFGQTPCALGAIGKGA